MGWFVNLPHSSPRLFSSTSNQYHYVTEPIEEGGYWIRQPPYIENETEASELSGSGISISPQDLFYGSQHEEIHYDHDPTPNPISLLPIKKRSLLGNWSGIRHYDDGKTANGLISFKITSVSPSGEILGSGIGAYGSFTLHGHFQHPYLGFVKEYIRTSQSEKAAYRYEGEVGPDFDEVAGKWFLTDGTNNVDMLSPARSWSTTSTYTDSDDSLAVSELSASDCSCDPHSGTFLLKRRAVDYFLYRPSDEEFRANRVRALWHMAMNAILQSVQARHLQWKIIMDRRDRRRRYIELIAQKEEHGHFSDEEVDEWQSLIRTIRPEDLQYWGSVAYFTMRRQIFH
jgi:hypothetical protein